MSPLIACRDCRRCTESALKRGALLLVRALSAPITRPVRLVRRKCRRCGHPLSWHAIVY